MRAAFPGAVRSALDGDLAPLLRLRAALRRDRVDRASRRATFSTAAYAATTCEEAELPVGRAPRPSTSVAPRRRATRESVPAGGVRALRPARPRSTTTSSALCELWPGRPDRPRLRHRPAAGRARPAARGRGRPAHAASRPRAGWPRMFPQVAPVRGLGHRPLRARLRLQRLHRARLRPLLPRPAAAAPVPPRAQRGPRPARPPSPTRSGDLARGPGLPGRRGRAVRAVALTLDRRGRRLRVRLLQRLPRRASSTRGAGLRGGRWEVRPDGDVVLRGVRFVPGVRVSGRIRRFLEPASAGACASAAGRRRRPARPARPADRPPRRPSRGHPLRRRRRSSRRPATVRRPLRPGPCRGCADGGLAALGIALAVYAAFVGVLVLLGRREEARAWAALVPHALILTRGCWRTRVYRPSTRPCSGSCSPTSSRRSTSCPTSSRWRGARRRGGGRPSAPLLLTRTDRMLIAEHWPGPERSLQLVLRLAGGRR